MKTNALKLIAALVAGSALFTALPAEAGRDEWRDRHEYRDQRDWRGDHRGNRHGGRHFKEDRWSPRHDRVVIRERVVVQRRPVVREYRYYERPVEYYAPAPIYSRNPGIVIGVNIPPIIIPFR